MVDNHFTFIGRFTADPELRTLENGTAVCNFALAGNETRNGERVAIYPEFTAYGKRAETIAQYMHKGNMLAVEARYTERFWEDKNGNRRKSVTFVADNYRFMDGKRNSDTTQPDTTATPETPSAEVVGNTDGASDDLPF